MGLPETSTVNMGGTSSVGPGSRFLALLCVLAALATSAGSLAVEDNAFEWAEDSAPLSLFLESLRGEGLPSRRVREIDETVVPWYSRATLGEADSGSREELQVTSVVKDDNFNFGRGVRKWHSLVVGSTTYLVGIISSKLAILTAKFVAPNVGSGHTYSMSEQYYDLGGTPSASTLFKHWNPATKALEAIFVHLTNGNLVWHRITDSGLDTIPCDWPLPKANYLKVFQVKDQMKLLILPSCTMEIVQCRPSVSIYDFTLGESVEARISQVWSLEDEAVFAETGVAGDRVYLVLALPGANVAKLYSFHWPCNSEAENEGNFICGHFELMKNFSSPRVAHTLFFHVNYKMYLAIGGESPAVYRFVSPTRLEGCPKALQGLGFVSRFLTLPVQSYRDEVVLLAEVELEVDSVLSRAVVTLTWASAGVFYWQQDIKCFESGVESPQGVSCIVAGTKVGLTGAVALQLGDAAVATVLVPREMQPSALYRIYCQLNPVPNPLLAAILQVKRAQNEINDEIQRQEAVILETEKLLKDTLSLRGPNIVTSDWIIQVLETDEYDGTSYPEPNPGLPSRDETVDISDLKRQLFELEGSLKSLKHDLLDVAIPVNGMVKLEGHINLLGGLEVTGKSEFDSLSARWLNDVSVASLLKDAVRLDRSEKIGGVKTVTNLRAVNVNFSAINNVLKDDLIFDVPQQPIRVDGRLEVKELLHVIGNVHLPPGGTVGDLDLSEQIFVPGTEFNGVVRFDDVVVEGNLTVNVLNTVAMNPPNLRSIASGSHSLDQNTVHETLHVPGHIYVDKINGIQWNDYVKRIVYRDLKSSIHGETTIEGTLTAQNMQIGHLNGLNFPDDYVLKNTNNQIISGKKTILNELLVKNVYVSNTVDSIPVNSFMTLTTNQNLDGELKLQEADIYGDMKVDWAVNGIKLDQMNTRSPLINEGEVISSNVVFSHLEVDGPIQISSTVDDRELRDDLLDILVLPPDSSGSVLITGKKIVEGALKVGGTGIVVQTINEKKVSNIASNQNVLEFKGPKSIQQVVFKDVQLTGLWDGVNVVELNADAVRLSGMQSTTARLTFAQPAELAVSTLVISEKINNYPVHFRSELSPNFCDSFIPGVECTVVRSFNASIIRVGGSVTVDGKVCGWNLEDFERRRLSRSRPQNIIGPLSFNTLDVNTHIRVEAFNGQLISLLGTKRVPTPPAYDLTRLLLGGFAVDELNVQGNVHTSQGVNGVNLKQIAENAVKLTGGNTFLGTLIFEDALGVGSVTVRGNTFISGVNYTHACEDVVLKNEVGQITISGRKTFMAGFEVDGNIYTSSLNGLNPSKIITKQAPVVVPGSIRVLGDVYGGNMNLTGLLNQIPISNYQNRYKLVSEGRHVLNGNTHFQSGVSVDDLFINDSVEGLKLEAFFNSVVMKNESARILAPKIFLNRVVFEDVDVRGLVNEQPLRELVKDVVLHNDDEPVTIKGNLTFVKTLSATRGVSLSENLDAFMLDGCLIKEWLDNAIYITQPTNIAGLKKFSSMASDSNLRLAGINAVDLSKVITLDSPQDIPYHVKMIAAVLSHNLKVGGLVNGRILQSEFENTLMTSGNQIVTGTKTFLNGVTVEGNIMTDGFISGRNMTNIVTLQDNEVINGPLKFSDMVIDGDLSVVGLISNIDIPQWKETAFLKNTPGLQVVTGSWNVQGQVKFLESVGGGALLDSENVLNLADDVYRSREKTRETQRVLEAEWTQLCHETNHILEEARAQPFLFQMLEVVQSIAFNKPIASMHAFEALDEQFLAVSYSDHCSGAMYRWNSFLTAWELLNGEVENIGSIGKWASLQNAGSTYLITSAEEENNCPFRGGNIWRFIQPPVTLAVTLQNVRNTEAWHDAQVDEQSGQIHLLRHSGVESWVLRDGATSPGVSWSIPEADQAQFIPRSAGMGLSTSDGTTLSLLETTGGNETSGVVSRSANTNLPARSKGSLATMKIADGRKLLAVHAEDSNLLVVYEDVATGHPLAKVSVHGVHSLSVLELTAPGRHGQTLLAFIENEKQLRVVQYKGVEGFVDVTRAKLPFSIKEMIPVRLHSRGLVNQRHYLLLRSDKQIISIEVEVAGDPLDDPPLQCNLP